MGVGKNEAALTQAVEAWNSGDVTKYLELYGEGIKLHSGTYDFPDKDSVEAMYRSLFTATSDLRLEIHETFGHGDKLAARYSVTGTHTAELMGIPATGGRIAITGITIMHFEDGKVVERWDVDDSVEVFSRMRGDSTAP
jgi:steroid delta-isomerase-like uncharacterized protein